MYRKPTNADITIQYVSNHPQDHKQAAFTFYINRMLKANHHRSGIEERMGKNTQHSPNNGFPINIIHNTKKERNSETKGKTGQERGTANKTNTE